MKTHLLSLIMFLACATVVKRTPCEERVPCACPNEQEAPYCLAKRALETAEAKLDRGEKVEAELQEARDAALLETDPMLRAMIFAWIGRVEMKAGQDPAESILKAREAMQLIPNERQRALVEEDIVAMQQPG